MKTKIFFAGLLFAVFCLISTGYSQVPQMINYQGVLTDSLGNRLNGNYDMTFSIYDTSDGGTPLWTQTQNGVSVGNGVFNVFLPIPDSVWMSHPELNPRYIGVSISSHPEMNPRSAIVSVPFAYHSGDWAIDGINIYRLTGSVGIGEIPSGSKDLILKDGDAGEKMPIPPSILTVSGINARVIYSKLTETNAIEDTRTAIYGYRTRTVANDGAGYGVDQTNNAITGYNYWGDVYTFGVAGYCDNDHTRTGGVIGAESYASYWGALGYKDESLRTWGIYTPSNTYLGGNVGIGTTTPAQKLDVAGTAKMTGFQMPTGATNGYVLTSNASGVGTWQAAPGGIGGSGTANYIPKFTAATTIGNSVIYQSGGNVGIGTTTPAQKLVVAGTAEMTGFKMPTGASNGYVLTANASGEGAWQPAPSGFGGNRNVSAETSGEIILNVSPMGRVESYYESGNRKLKLVNTNSSLPMNYILFKDGSVVAKGVVAISSSIVPSVIYSANDHMAVIIGAPGANPWIGKAEGYLSATAQRWNVFYWTSNP